jgi:hypothetical protein
VREREERQSCVAYSRVATCWFNLSADRCGALCNDVGDTSGCRAPSVLSVDPGVSDAEYNSWYAGNEGFSPFKNQRPDPGVSDAEYQTWWPTGH